MARWSRKSIKDATPTHRRSSGIGVQGAIPAGGFSATLPRAAVANRAPVAVKGERMLRKLTLISILAMTGAFGAPAAWAQTYSWGVFRENVPNAPDDQKNCWTQAMVAGETINGELMAERLTQPQAELALQHEARRGLCAHKRSSANWSARNEDESDRGWSDHNGFDHSGSGYNGSDHNGSDHNGSGGNGSGNNGSGYNGSGGNGRNSMDSTSGSSRP
jgi:hypothetical protein